MLGLLSLGRLAAAGGLRPAAALLSSLAAAASCFGPALFMTLLVMMLFGYKAHSSDPGVI